MSTKQDRTLLYNLRGVRASRFVGWAARYVARGGKITDDLFHLKLSAELDSWAKMYLGRDKSRHNNLIYEAERALLLALEVRETLPIGSKEREKLSKATHYLTGALIREGR